MKEKNTEREGTVTVNTEADIPRFLWGQLIIVQNKIHVVGTPTTKDFPLGSSIQYKKEKSGYSFSKI